MTFNRIRLHRDDSDDSKSFYWDIKTRLRVGEGDVRRLAGEEHFFVPEQRFDAKEPLTREANLEKLIGRMENWKFVQAAQRADRMFMSNQLEYRVCTELWKLSAEYGDCGWQEGKAFEKVYDRLRRIAGWLGYRYNEDGGDFEEDTGLV